MLVKSISRRIRNVCLGSAALVATPPGVMAQTGANGVETVVVTGTRIPRPEIDLPNPVTALSAEEIEHSGTTNLADFLKRIPALTGSLGDFQTNGYGSPSSADGSSLGGLNLLDLRNLGYVRTLVLIDGHRVVSSATGSAAVDVSSIPITLIDRVDVVTGGASAVYGADGVSGVVNFVMKHDLEGVHASAQAGTSQDGGGSKYRLTVSAGHNFDDDKANLTATYEISYQDHLFFTQRKFTNVGGYVSFVSNPNDPNDDPKIPDFIPTRDAQFLFSAPTGAIETDGPDFLNSVPDHLGNGQVFNLGTSVGGGSAIGSSGMPHAIDLQGDFQPTERRHIAQLNGKYDFSKYFRFSGEFKFAGVDTQALNIAPFDDFTVISSDNPFLPANVAALMAAGGGFGVLSEDYLQLRGQENDKRNTYRAVLDVTGDIPNPSFLSGFHYDLSYVYGQTDVDDVNLNNRVTDRFFAALDAVTDPGTGKPTCRSNLNPAAVPPDVSQVFGPDFVEFSDTSSSFSPSQFPATFTPGPNSGCVPFNPFDPNANNKASIAFMSMNTHVHGVLTQHVVSGFVGADIPAFQDWGFAKPLSVVLGGEYRRESSAATPDAITQTPGLFWVGGTSPVRGSYDVREVFGEASLTIFEKQRFLEELSFDLAARQSHYSTAGDSTSWKIGAVYSPIPAIRFRGTTAVAVRAPNIGELFAPQQNLFATVNDPCDANFVNNGTSFRVANCQAIENALGVPYTPGVTSVQTDQTTPNLVGGNPNLKAETARTLTAGVVLQPDFLPSFVATVDWYRVTITNAISAPAAQDVANECVDLSTINNPFCAQITRTPAGKFPGSISSVASQQINVAAFFTEGEDFKIVYHADTQDWFDENYGGLDFQIAGNHLESLTTTPLPGEAPIQSANTIAGGVDGTPAPTWQANLDIVWHLERFAIDYNLDWYDGVLAVTRQTFSAQPDIRAPQYIHVAPRYVQDIQLTYDAGSGWVVYGGINNLFYQKPSIGQSGYPVDPLGRFFYVGIRSDLDFGAF